MVSDHLPDITNTTTLSPDVPDPVFRALLEKVQQGEKVQFELVELVFVDEPEILRINRSYLGHDYVTDIITFRYDEEEQNRQSIEATLFCCLPRIAEQATELNIPFSEEVKRVYLHGLLHLCGYEDDSEEERTVMRDAENRYLFDN